MKRAILAAVAVAVALAIGSTVQAGAMPGPKERTTVVNARGTDQFRLTFRGGEVAIVTVRGSGVSDLDLYVYDSTGRLVAKDDDNTDRCLVLFTPTYTGEYTIRVVNRGVANGYTIRTN